MGTPNRAFVGELIKSRILRFSLTVAPASVAGLSLGQAVDRSQGRSGGSEPIMSKAAEEIERKRLEAEATVVELPDFIDPRESVLPVPHPIGIGCNRARIYAGFSVRELAHRIETSQATLNAVLRGEKSPRYDMIERIADECGQTVEWIQWQSRLVPARDAMPRRRARG